MRGRVNTIWRSHGSADELKQTTTGWEWLRIYKFMSNKLLFFLTCFFNMVSCLGPYINSLVQGRLATILVESKFSAAELFVNQINKVADQYLYLILITFATGITQWITESYFMPQFTRDLKTAIMSALVNQDIQFYDETETGVILSRITEDAENAYQAYTMKLISLLRCIVQWVCGVIVCFSQSPKLSFILLLTAPLYMIVQKFGDKKIDELWFNYNDCSTAVSAKSEEVLTSFRTVRAFDAEKREYKNYKDRLHSVYEVIKKNSIIHGTKEFLSAMIQWGSASLILYVTGMQAADGEIEPGTIVVFISIINLWNNAFSGIFSIMTEFSKSNVSSAKILEIIENDPQIKLKVGREISDVKGKIEFKDVTFTYASRDKPALNGLSFVVEPGQTVAIVGESGCGKSTTLQLLERFYDCQSGEVLIDGHNVKDIAPQSLRKYVAFVPQAPTMFSMNIKNNIRYGKPGAHKEEIIHAAQVANAHEFIIQQPKGYATAVHQNSLSGGQKQRLCIARAIMMDAPILLLDEATAALDAESEHLVQNAISDYRVGKSVVIVAHRLSTVMHADKILVMSQGTIIEEGKHEELIEKGGAYAELVKHQLQ